eukprot:jgi/Tetstr1/431381/TSEL_021072.t1
MSACHSLGSVSLRAVGFQPGRSLRARHTGGQSSISHPYQGRPSTPLGRRRRCHPSATICRAPEAGVALTSRRAAVGGLLAGATLSPATQVSAASARSLVFTGQERFQKGEVMASVRDFDAALELQPSLKPYLWQRGLSLYYADQFQEGLEQFTSDVAVNPNDTEEAIWAFLCEARLSGFEAARGHMLQVGRDRRAVMRIAYDTFREAESAEQLVALAAKSPSGGGDAFYSQLYAALFNEAKGDAEAAQALMTAAVRTPYAQRSGDYMASLAAVHCQQRGWPQN